MAINAGNLYPSIKQPMTPERKGFNHPLHDAQNGRQARVSCSLGMEPMTRPTKMQ